MSTTTLAPPLANVPFVGKHYEVVGGEYRELPPMGARQSLLANLLSQLLNTWGLPKNAGHIVVEVLFQLDANATLQRRPDVAFVSAARWPLDRVVTDEAAWDVVPNVAVEVVSPTNTMNEIIEKIDDYFAYGVERVWIVLPKQNRIQVYSSPASVQVFDRGDVLRDADILPGFELPVASLFPPYLS